MNVNRSGYYKWKSKDITEREKFRENILGLVQSLHEKHPSHGYRWINNKLFRETNIKISDNYVYKCFKFLGIKSETKHKYHYKRNQNKEKWDNLIGKKWNTVTKPFEVIVSDMTTFWASYAYYELTMYFDVYSKAILGYGLSKRRGDRRTYYRGLEMVLKKIKEESQVENPKILHTDQGSVYSSKEYNTIIKDFNINRSMSRPGTPTDNPVNETLNGWIKEELFVDFGIARESDIPRAIARYIDYYNNERPSYALDYQTPAEVYCSYFNKEPKLDVSISVNDNVYFVDDMYT